MQYQAATSRAQPWQHGSVTVELQTRPMFGLTLAHWGQRYATLLQVYHLVPFSMTLVPSLPCDLYTVGAQYVLAVTAMQLLLHSSHHRDLSCVLLSA